MAAAGWVSKRGRRSCPGAGRPGAPRTGDGRRWAPGGARGRPRSEVITARPERGGTRSAPASIALCILVRSLSRASCCPRPSQCRLFEVELWLEERDEPAQHGKLSVVRSPSASSPATAASSSAAQLTATARRPAAARLRAARRLRPELGRGGRLRREPDHGRRESSRSAPLLERHRPPTSARRASARAAMAFNVRRELGERRASRRPSTSSRRSTGRARCTTQLKDKWPSCRHLRGERRQRRHREP